MIWARSLMNNLSPRGSSPADFCQFAIDVEEALKKHTNATKKTGIGLVNQQSKSDFNSWKQRWCIDNKLSNYSETTENSNTYQQFEVLSITDLSLIHI